MDAACPGSLEISGHCLAAARVIASLLVVPGKKRAQHKRQCEKKTEKKDGGVGRDRENKLLGFPKLTVKIIPIFMRKKQPALTENPVRYQPIHSDVVNTTLKIYVLVAIHRAVIKDKYRLSRAALKKRMEEALGRRRGGEAE